MKKYLTILFLIAFTVPSVALASWWNPFTWKIFQRKEVPQVQVEIEKTPEEKINELQKQLDDLKKQQPASTSTTTTQVEKETKKTVPVTDNPAVVKTQSDINTYLTGVAAIHCGIDDNSWNIWSGSGSLWKIDKTFYVLTNKHVIGNQVSCYIDIGQRGDEKIGGIYKLDTQNVLSWNTKTDIAVLKIMYPKSGWGDLYFATTQDLNYSISTMKLCATTMPVGSSVMIIGYPAFAVSSPIQKTGFRTVTDGIIAHDTNTTVDGLPYADYYVSAKMDGGNSGGIALSKDKDGLCLLGIPTWLSFGDYETQGMVQNIHNVMFIE